jgi:hypothetical protein
MLPRLKPANQQQANQASQPSKPTKANQPSQPAAQPKPASQPQPAVKPAKPEKSAKQLAHEELMKANMEAAAKRRAEKAAAHAAKMAELAARQGGSVLTNAVQTGTDAT